MSDYTPKTNSPHHSQNSDYVARNNDPPKSKLPSKLKIGDAAFVGICMFFVGAICGILTLPFIDWLFK